MIKRTEGTLRPPMILLKSLKKKNRHKEFKEQHMVTGAWKKQADNHAKWSLFRPKRERLMLLSIHRISILKMMLYIGLALSNLIDCYKRKSRMRLEVCLIVAANLEMEAEMIVLIRKRAPRKVKRKDRVESTRFQTLIVKQRAHICGTAMLSIEI